MIYFLVKVNKFENYGRGLYLNSIHLFLVQSFLTREPINSNCQRQGYRRVAIYKLHFCKLCILAQAPPPPKKKKKKSFLIFLRWEVAAQG